MKDALPRHRRLSQEVEELLVLCNRERIPIGEIFDHLTLRGHALLTALFSLMFFVPIPIPGLSMILGPIIVVIGIAMASGKAPWFPMWLRRRKLPGAIVAKALRLSERGLEKLERVIRPRGKFLIRNRWVHRFNGAMIALGGALLALPLPPGTNTPPAIGILILSIGILEQDGILVIMGYVVTFVVATMFSLAGFLGVEGLRSLLGSMAA